MAVTIVLQNNPVNSSVGTDASKATIIRSGLEGGGNITYEIQTRITRERIVLNSKDSIVNSPNIILLNEEQVQIILRSRTKYRARVREEGKGPVWSDWVSFKTRDTRYASPGAASELTDDNDTNVGKKKSVRITVTNSAKATVVNTAKGATVTNTDFGYVTTTNIKDTTRGATVINSE